MMELDFVKISNIIWQELLNLLILHTYIYLFLYLFIIMFILYITNFSQNYIIFNHFLNLYGNFFICFRLDIWRFEPSILFLTQNFIIYSSINKHIADLCCNFI